MYEFKLFLNTNNGELMMNKKFYFLIISLTLIFGLFIYRVVYLAYNKHDFYMTKLKNIEEVYISGSSAPRGRILDINGKVIVDNIGTNTILYHKNNNVTLNKEIDIAKRLVELTNYQYKYNESILKDYYILLYPEVTNNLITEEERRLYSERKITKDEIYNLKLTRISEEMLNKLSDLEKYSSYFYYLMNDGYSYQNKELLKDVNDEVYASIIEANLNGVFGEMNWSRNYLYGDTLKSILGSISNSLPREKTYLLKEGYSYSDRIGISGLEEYYEEYLKGEKALYKLENNNLVLVSEAKRGKDLVLEIDIEMQVKVENIIKEQIKVAKTRPNTEYFRESYALISDPNTGNIRSIAGIRLMDNGEFQDVSINTIKNAYTVGSAVKGASMAVGYQNKAIDIGSSMVDGCVKLYNNPAKCSFMRLGYLNDIRALSMSSNYYQFIIALRVAGYNYRYNMEALVTEDDFNKYRNTFLDFGLGNMTGIDLKGEGVGLKGDKVAPDLLLNLAIGQYDLYTPVQMLQYINTIANNGSRLKLNLMHSIKSDGEIIAINSVEKLGQVNLEEKYMKRIQEGLREVIKSGTGYWYINQNIPASGKTGTSESYIDSNYDGKLDAYVISNSFVEYAPSNNPKYSIVVISPNISSLKTNNDYQSPVNRLIAKNINDFLFSS